MAGSKPGRPRTNGPTCGAKAANGPCRNPAGMKTDHVGYGRCHRHGGATPNHMKHVERPMAEDAARTFGLEVETTAEDALLQALFRAVGTVMFYRSHVRKLTDDQMVYGTERITRTARAVPGTPGSAQTVEDVTVAKSVKNVWVILLAEAEAHLLKVAGTVATLNIEQRRVAMAEEQGAFFYRAMVLVLDRYGIRDDDPQLPVIIGEVIEGLTT